MIKHYDVRCFDHPDAVHEGRRGKLEVVRISGMTVGRATYEPGWRWSVDFGPASETRLCEVEHVGYVVRGHAVCEMADGTRVDLTEGDLFHILPGHDSWVVGDEPYVSIHLTGVERYAPGKHNESVSRK